jgi:hypothetical protein
MSPDADVRARLLNSIKVYPYNDRANPRPTEVLRKDGQRLKGVAVQPRGLAYFERLADILNREVVDERDRFFHAMLQPLGIEKGKAFEPTESQKEILTEAALVGEAMAKANDFYNPRIKASIYREGSAWEIATTSPANQRRENFDALDGRAAWFYEALTNGPAMNSQKPGWGQKYLASYLDSDKDWLDGARNYRLHVPADVPAAAFWSITVYDVSTRCPIDNKKNRRTVLHAWNCSPMPTARLIFTSAQKPPKARRKTGCRRWRADPGSPTSVFILRQRDSSTSPGSCRISRRPSEMTKKSTLTLTMASRAHKHR